ncbi:MAG: GNAT family N-acetyltransferase [Acidobacteria bacterium]|nr:GNAT family N-acetyltransferase [Acidobacteriota bacterium]
MIEIQHLTTFAEYEDVVGLQREVWGSADLELLPSRSFLIAHRTGGQVLGAFDSGRLVGFCLAHPGFHPDGSSYLHSQMLAVLPAYRDHGIGRQLKLAQRSDALRRGIKLIEWTFDPLELRNAFLNIERLGAIVRRFVRNHYGVTTSELHRGMPTHRCIAEWHLDLARTESIVHGGDCREDLVEACIEVPADIGIVRRQQPGQAIEIQESVARQFEACLERGLAAVGFERMDGGGRYLLGPWRADAVSGVFPIQEELGALR